MIIQDDITLFIFVFSCLSITRFFFKVIVSLLHTPPKYIGLSNRELLFYGFIFSYFITYLITN